MIVDPWIGLQLRIELAVADVDTRNAEGAGLQEAIRKPACGRSYIQAARTLNTRSKVLDRRRELHSAAANIWAGVTIHCNLIACCHMQTCTRRGIAIDFYLSRADQRLRGAPAARQSALRNGDIEPASLFSMDVNGVGHKKVYLSGGVP